MSYLPIQKDPPRLQKKFQQEITPEMCKQFGYSNPYRVPRMKKVVINMGLGEASRDPKSLELATRALSKITGQKPIPALARHSIAAFHIRKGMTIGLKTTLRGRRMYDFLDRLFHIVLPRFRDFRGLPVSGFDGHGNYTIGVKEQLVFPEVSFEDVDKPRGMNVTLVTTARSDEEAAALLTRLGMPLKEGI